MRDAIKNIFLMGVGAASLTKKKAEATVKVFVKKGIINNKQAKEIINRVMNETNKVRSRLMREGRKEIGRVKKKVLGAGKKARKKVSKSVSKAARKIISGR